MSVAVKEAPPAPEPLPHPVVDNHCHLDTAREYGGPGVREALDAAKAVGVTRIVQVGCDLEGSRWAVETANAFDEIVAAVAIHPNEAPRLGDDLAAALDEIDRMAASGPRVRAVGETGLDYFRTGKDGRPAQHESFREHIRIAKRHDKTLVIHDRDAHDDILKVLDSEGVPDRVVMHCFSGDGDFARECLDRGAWLSFAGTVTFKSADDLREALKAAPRDKILVETDAPFLTPMPHRGGLNASYLIPLTVRFMADFLGISADGLCRDIDVNTDRAFGGNW
ncbi:MAG: TatD family hydrolase [Aeromicrobium sp.]